MYPVGGKTALSCPWVLPMFLYILTDGYKMRSLCHMCLPPWYFCLRPQEILLALLRLRLLQLHAKRFFHFKWFLSYICQQYKTDSNNLHSEQMRVTKIFSWSNKELNERAIISPSLGIFKVIFKISMCRAENHGATYF